MSDLAEARAFRRIFGPGGVPVTALKGYMGNLASGCGAVEYDGQLDRRESGQDPADPQLRSNPIRRWSWTWSLKSPRPTGNPIFVNTNLTPNGQAAALVIRGQAAPEGGSRSDE